MGATVSEAKSIIDNDILDARKLSAYKFWGLVEDGENGRLKLKELGRTAARDKGAHLVKAMQEVIKSVPAYMAVAERALHKREYVVSAVEVATHWHEHFNESASANETILNQQAVCYFSIAGGAGLGTLIVGRKGAPTRFEFTEAALVSFADRHGDDFTLPDASDDDEKVEIIEEPAGVLPAALVTKPVTNNKVFITHGQNKKVLDQIKDIVAYGGFEPIVAQERESAAKPVPEKVMDDMRQCAAAVIHVSAEGVYADAKGKENPKINDNVLIEIGAAMALYRRNFILVVEDGLDLPSNLQGLYECRYAGDELSSAATMKLLKAFKTFRDE